MSKRYSIVVEHKFINHDGQLVTRKHQGEFNSTNKSKGGLNSQYPPFVVSMLKEIAKITVGHGKTIDITVLNITYMGPSPVYRK